ncbi:UvrD-helicase domain-containing protein, partial [Chitinimonas sp.]|uniref:UvrD-helicase domain-containing protein n=1 Tax=Chitinimonas sp. TaxID=1934313 RepID=UPI0035AFB392
MSFDPLALPLDGLQLIEASAGTGKTWTIAALYLRLVLQGGADGKGLSPEQILVVTFTRAATAELRGRIRARLAELASALEQQLEGHGPAADPLCAALIAQLPPEQLSDALRRVTAAVSGFDAAAIFTIHSFCQRALGEHALLAGLELGSELVADEADMVQAAFDSAYKQALALGDASWVDWLVDQGETPDRWRAELGRYLGQPWLKIEAPLVDAGPADAEFARAWEAVQQHWRNSELDDLRAAVAGGRYNGRLLRSDWLESSIERWQRWLGGP